MAKDGTCRGGVRPGLGRPPKALKDKIVEGKAESAMILPEPCEISGVDIPKPKDYMLDEQKNGEEFCAAEVLKETYLWLKARGCEKLVSRQQLDQYSVDVARWIQCQRAISQYGFLAKHPTTGNATTSPYISMSREFSKQINADWYLIQQIVKENSSFDYDGSAPHDEFMSKLLSAQGKKHER